MAWAGARSVACMPASIHTTAGPSAANSCASSSPTRARASVALISRQRSRFSRLSALEMTSIGIGLPLTVRPMVFICTRSLAALSWA